MSKDQLCTIGTVYKEEIQSLNDLIVQGDCVFLIGAGCSKVAGLPLMEELTTRALSSSDLEEKSKRILDHISKQYAQASSANIEDYLSEMVDYLSIVQRRENKEVEDAKISLDGLSLSSRDLNAALNQVKNVIAEAVKLPKNGVDISTHQRFVQAVHRTTRPGLHLGKRKITYLILNYDTLMEDALALEKIPFYDGIDGGASGWWNFEKFENEDIGSKVLKLHGSIDWTMIDSDPLPRRIAFDRIKHVSNKNVMIWPASTKFRETQLDPFAQLLNLTRRTLKPGGKSEKVLMVMGYSFSDAHINYELDKALRGSEDGLTVVVFISDEEPKGLLKTWCEDESIKRQVRIYADKGFYHGDNIKHSKEGLSWWKFESIVKLLRGEIC